MRLPAPVVRRAVLPSLGAVIVGAMLLVVACDPSVTVLEPSDQYRFSLYGTLRVTADTQVIRVEPLADTIQLGAPDELDVTVFLENLDTGTEVSLNDSLTAVGGGIAQVHNFWTTHPIDGATTYRVSVQVDGEAVTTATTTTPAQPPTLEHMPDSTDDRAFRLPCEFNFQGDPIESQNTFTARASGVDAVAAVKVRYPIEVQRPESTPWVDHYEDVQYSSEEDIFRISVFYAKDLIALHTPETIAETNSCPSISDFMRSYATLKVAAGGPDWPEWRGSSINDIARPDTFSNVQGGHGFVGGVHVDTIRIPVRQRE